MNLPTSRPHYYTANEVRNLRDKDRRHYRNRVAFVVIFMIIVGVVVRLVLDFFAPHLPGLQVFIIPAVLVVVLSLWVFGLQWAFARTS